MFVLDVGVEAVYHGAFCEEFGAGFGVVGAWAAAAVAVDQLLDSLDVAANAVVEAVDCGGGFGWG